MLLGWVLLTSTAACTPSAKGGPAGPSDYSARRAAFHSALHESPRARRPAPAPPAGVYELVKYPAPLGLNTAYITPLHEDGKKHPAMLWIHGGFDWSIGALGWAPASRDNDQSGRAFREAGMVEMLPSLRGCNDNPGDHEYFLGEVDDILAALDYLRARPDVDPDRVYLGGHSTGATLSLLVAATRPRVRAVFALGPIDWVKSYSKTGTVLDTADDVETAIRSPAASLADVVAPTFVIEGSDGNVKAFPALRAGAGKAPVQFLVAGGATHFGTVAPVTELIAGRLVQASAFDLSEADVTTAVARR